MNTFFTSLLLTLVTIVPLSAAVEPDVLIYRATPAGIAAAIAADQSGSRVMIIEPTAHVGGMMTSGGLVVSDVGHFPGIGGISRDFFRRIQAYYDETYGKDSPQAKTASLWNKPGTVYEPKVGEKVFQQMLSEHPGIQIKFKQDLKSVERERMRIAAVTTQPDGMTYRAKVFIDASYTGDLLAMAGASHRIGRDARSRYNETLATTDEDNSDIQASNYRMTTTNVPENRVPITKPDDYNPELYRWWLDLMRKETEPKLWGKIFHDWWKLPNGKMDTNVADLPGLNHDYPTATPERRREIELAHRHYSLGFLYFLQNDPRVPETIRKDAAGWGLPKDEFQDNGNFPREMYLRESRRLVGEYVMTQNDAQTHKRKPDSIGLGTYSIDSHATTLRIGDDGTMHKSGFIYQDVTPYEIPYRALTPKRTELTNLLVPVCVSSSHVGFAGLRLEPTYMIMGEAAGVAAHLAAKNHSAVQDVDIAELQERLQARKVILKIPQ